MATLLRDSAGKSIDESETSAGKILKEAVTSKERKVMCQSTSFTRTHTTFHLMRSTAWVIGWQQSISSTDTWTDTNMEYLVLRIVVRMQPRVMTSNKKHFRQAYDAHYSQYVLGGIG
jgi:hypothetical protein